MDGNAEKNGFGPICERREKGKRRIMEMELSVIIGSVFLFVIYRMLAYKKDVAFSIEDFYFMAGTSAAIILSEGIRRCCLFAEERHHVKKRYKGSYSDAVQACISLPRGKVVVAIVLIGSLGYSIESWLNQEKYSFSFLLYFIISLSFSLCSNLLDIEGSTDVERSERNEKEPKNVSAGAAWNYYFGYLKILLPSFPTIFEKARGEKYRIDGEDIRDRVTDTSLFIIIPKDGYCYKALNLVDDRLQFQHTMPELKRTRGGVAERIYKNSLYKVEVEHKEPKYAVIEYATPLLCFYDMAEHAKVNFTSEDKEKEIIQFYLKLKEIISNDPECAGRCKFILTGPVATNDIDKERKLADIIYEEINQ